MRASERVRGRYGEQGGESVLDLAPEVVRFDDDEAEDGDLRLEVSSDDWSWLDMSVIAECKGLGAGTGDGGGEARFVRV